MENETETKRIYKLVDDTVRALGEHVEAVVVMVTWTHDGESARYQNGVGNHYAREGMIRESAEILTARVMKRFANTAPEDME